MYSLNGILVTSVNDEYVATASDLQTGAVWVQGENPGSLSFLKSPGNSANRYTYSEIDPATQIDILYELGI